MLPDWTRGARHLTGVVLEIGFPVQPDFYFGPENRFTDEMWERMREPLHVPAVEASVSPSGFARPLLTHSLEHSVDELIRYYSDVLRLISQYRKKVIDHRYYFTLEPILYSPDDDFELRYFLNEHWETAALALNAFEDPRDGVLFDQIDQSWALQVVGAGDRLYIRVSDPDSEDEDGECVSCSRAGIAAQVAPLRERTRRIRTALSTAFPVDYWSLLWLHRAWGVPDSDWTDVDCFGAAPPTAG